ncbi:MAG: NAD(P)H-dependent oxidoreductase [Bacteroidota bacterium]
MKEGLIILGSSRSQGNTRKVVDALRERTGWDFVDLNDKQIGYYDYEYRNAGDDFIPLMEQLVEYKRVVFVTPVYWYSMSAVMKTFFDRITEVLKTRRDLRYALEKVAMGMLSSSESDDRIAGFEVPFRESAGYLRMPWLGDAHIWVEQGRLPLAAVGRLEDWLQELR